MQYVNINTKLAMKKYEKINNYNFDFLEIIEKSLPIEVIYHYINHLIDYKLKNVWNSIDINWIQINNKMKKRNKKKYITSIYPTQNYEHNHNIISYEQLNNLLKEFIKDDIFKALFVFLIIQNTFHI